MDRQDKILQKPIKQLNTSSSFEERCNKMGLLNLAAILTCNQRELQEKAEFSYLWLEELLEILNKYDLMGMWQPITGRNPV